MSADERPPFAIRVGAGFNSEDTIRPEDTPKAIAKPPASERYNRLVGDFKMSHEERIENCKFLFECPQRWEEMDFTDEEMVRHCQVCRENVYLVTTQPELDHNISLGLCTAFYDPERELMIVGTVALPPAPPGPEYSVHLLPNQTLNVQQIKALKGYFGLAGNFLQIKRRYESTSEIVLLEREMESSAKGFAEMLDKVGLEYALRELDAAEG